MTGGWKAWKTKLRFPTLPTTLGNRRAIPTFPQPRRRVLPPPTGPNEHYGKEPLSIPTLSSPSRLILRLENAARLVRVSRQSRNVLFPAK